MPRKVKLAFVENELARKSYFNKRKQYVIKLIKDLTSLYGVDACAIIYGPHKPHPVVGPSSSEARRLISHVEDMPETEKKRAEKNQQKFLKQRLAKLNKQLEEVRKDVREKEITQLMFKNIAGILSQSSTGHELEQLSSSDLNDLKNVVDKKMEEIKKRIDTLAHTQVTAATVDNGVPKNEENVQPPTDDVYKVDMGNLDNPPEHIELEPELESLLASASDEFMNSLWA